jgi:diadenosine tetraphosphate (Ap4A) HIT family hydrolase
MVGMWRKLVLVATAALAAHAAIDRCGCDPAQPGTLTERTCSLTNEANKQAEGVEIFFLKDANPRKSNRTLALPRRIVPREIHELRHLSAAERNQLWRESIKKAKELWGDNWGVAYNGVNVRTQCHLHVHIGKLLKGVDSGKAIYVRRLEDIPVPKDGTGLWIHPVGNRLKVHLNEQICETVLLR